MSRFGNQVWMGKYHNAYYYDVATIRTAITHVRQFQGLFGNFIYCRREGELWIPVYIGRGHLADWIGPYHSLFDGILRKGATHFHFHPNGDPDAEREEADLLFVHPEACEPTGCNLPPSGGGDPGFVR